MNTVVSKIEKINKFLKSRRLNCSPARPSVFQVLLTDLASGRHFKQAQTFPKHLSFF